MTESNAAEAYPTDGPWLIEASPSGQIDLSALPTSKRAHVGYIYVVELGDLVKVGRTTTPRQRVGAYVGDAKVSGKRVKRAWVSQAHLNYWDNEKALLSFGRVKSKTTVRSEYFGGLRFERFMTQVATLNFDLPTEEALEALRIESERQFGGLRKALNLTRDERPAEDFSGFARQTIAELFGRLPDGTYTHGKSSLAEPEEASREAAEAVWDSMDAIADARGCTLASVLQMSAVDLLEEVILNIVQAEADRLRTYAYTEGVPALVEPTGERLRRWLPERFVSEDSELG